MEVNSNTENGVRICEIRFLTVDIYLYCSFLMNNENGKSQWILVMVLQTDEMPLQTNISTDVEGICLRADILFTVEQEQS